MLEPGAMAAYLIAFVLANWPTIHGQQERDMRADAEEVAATDCDAQACLRLMGIAALESGFRRDAVGAAGERGAWQVMPPATSYGAREALRRMRTQGLLGYIGCRRAADVVVIRGTRTTCAAMIAHRIERADLWRMAFDPPREVAAPFATTRVALAQ